MSTYPALARLGTPQIQRKPLTVSGVEGKADLRALAFISIPHQTNQVNAVVRATRWALTMDARF